MRTQSGTKKDRSAFLIPPIQPRMPWRVDFVQALPNFRLSVRFMDGTQGTIDISHLIHSPNACVFAVLADQALFEQVFVEHGSVTWPGEIDLAPDEMYAQIKLAAPPVR